MITASISIRWWKRSKAPPVRFIVLRGSLKFDESRFSCLNMFEHLPEIVSNYTRRWGVSYGPATAQLCSLSSGLKMVLFLWPGAGPCWGPFCHLRWKNGGKLCHIEAMPMPVPKIGQFWMFFLFGYGSIPINTIFNGMNIHLPAILGFTRYQGFDPSPFFSSRHLQCPGLSGHLPGAVLSLDG